MECLTYSGLSRALGVQPNLHPVEIPVMWRYARAVPDCIVEVGTGIGDSTLLLLAATSTPTRVYSIWGSSPTSRPATYEAVNHGIGALGLWPPGITGRFAYLEGSDAVILAQWHRPINLLVMKYPTDYRAVLDAVFPRLTKGAHIILTASTSFNGRSGAIECAQGLRDDAAVELVETAHAMTVWRWGHG